MSSTLSPRTRTAVTGGATILFVISAAVSAADMVALSLPMPKAVFVVLCLALGMVFLTAAIVLAARRTRYAAYAASVTAAWTLGAASDSEDLLLNGFSPYCVASLSIWLTSGAVLLSLAIYRHRRRRDCASVHSVGA